MVLLYIVLTSWRSTGLPNDWNDYRVKFRYNGVQYIVNNVCTRVTKCFTAHERVILVFRNPPVSAETVYESTYIISFLTRHNELINDDKNDDDYTSSPCLTRSVVFSSDEVTIDCWWRHNEQTIVTRSREEWYLTRKISLLFTLIFTASRVRKQDITYISLGNCDKISNRCWTPKTPYTSSQRAIYGILWFIFRIFAALQRHRTISSWSDHLCRLSGTCALWLPYINTREVISEDEGSIYFASVLQSVASFQCSYEYRLLFAWYRRLK